MVFFECDAMGSSADRDLGVGGLFDHLELSCIAIKNTSSSPASLIGALKEFNVSFSLSDFLFDLLVWTIFKKLKK